WAEEEPEAMAFSHATVMKAEVIAALSPAAGVYVDATVGGGGHAEAILAASARTKIVAFDRDPSALEAARERPPQFRGPPDVRPRALRRRRARARRAKNLRRSRCVRGLGRELAPNRRSDARDELSSPRPARHAYGSERGRDGARDDRAPHRGTARRRDLPRGR